MAKGFQICVLMENQLLVKSCQIFDFQAEKDYNDRSQKEVSLNTKNEFIKTVQEAVESRVKMSIQDIMEKGAEIEKAATVYVQLVTDDMTEEVSELNRLIPVDTIAFAETGITIAERLVSIKRAADEQIEDQCDEYLPEELHVKKEFVESVLTLGLRYKNAGHYDKALISLQEAVDICRDIYERDQQYEISDLYIKSLCGLSKTLKETGKLDPALSTVNDAVYVFESINNPDSENYPVSDEDKFNMSQLLSIKGMILNEMGIPGEALYNFREADRLLKILCKKNIFDYMGYHAENGIETGKCFRALKQYDKDMGVSKTALEYLRLLFQHNPDAYMKGLEKALSSMEDCYKILGKEEETSKIKEESARIK